MNKIDKQLFDSAAARDLKGVIDALDNGANIDVANADKRTALIRVAKRGYSEIVDVLIERGAKTNLLDKNNKTALMGAAKNGHRDIVEALAPAGTMHYEIKNITR